MRAASVHSSASPSLEPSRVSYFRESPQAAKVTPSNPPLPADKRSEPRVDSRSSNSTSWSTGSVMDEGFRSRVDRRSEVNPEPKPRSLQSAFANRNRQAKSIAQKQGDDDPFASKPKLSDDSPKKAVSQPRPRAVKLGETVSQSISPVETPVRDFDETPAVAGSYRSDLEIPDGINKPMQQCMHCSRRFNEDVIEKHEDICGRQKKRPKFDSRNHRLAGFQQAAAVAKTPLHPKRYEDRAVPVKKANWRDKSDQLRAAIGAARATDPFEKKRFEEDLARATQAALTRCEYCGRSFNSEAAQRHIPLCKSKAMMIPRNVTSKVTLAGAGASVSRVPRMPSVTKSPSAPALKAPPAKIRTYSNTGSRMRF